MRQKIDRDPEIVRESLSVRCPLRPHYYPRRSNWSRTDRIKRFQNYFIVHLTVTVANNIYLSTSTVTSYQICSSSGTWSFVWPVNWFQMYSQSECLSHRHLWSKIGHWWVGVQIDHSRSMNSMNSVIHVLFKNHNSWNQIDLHFFFFEYDYLFI